MKEQDFVGKEAHLRHREEEPAAILCTLTVDDHALGERRRALPARPRADHAARRDAAHRREGPPLVRHERGRGPVDRQAHPHGVPAARARGRGLDRARRRVHGRALPGDGRRRRRRRRSSTPRTRGSGREESSSASSGCRSPAGRSSLTDDAQAIETRHLGFTISPHEECGVEEAVRLVEAARRRVGRPHARPGRGGGAAARRDGARRRPRDPPRRRDGEEWDPQATAAAIVDAIRADEAASGPFDLVLFGNESADSGGYPGRDPRRACARPAGRHRPQGLAVDGGSVPCEQEVAGGRDVYVLPLPAVVTVLEGLNLPALPVGARPAARAAQAGRVELARAPAVAAREGAARRARGPRASRPRSSATAPTPRRASSRCCSRSGSRDRPRLPRARRRRGRRASLQALTLARGSRPASAGGGARRLSRSVTSSGSRRSPVTASRRLHVAEHDVFDALRAAAIAEAIAELAERLAATAVVAAGTERGQRGARPRRRARSTCRSRRTASPATPRRPVRVTRVRWGGSLLEEARVHALADAAHRAAPRGRDRAGAAARARAVESVRARALRRRPASFASSSASAPPAGGVSLADAKVVVSAGRGAGSPEGFGVVEELAACSAARSAARGR